MNSTALNITKIKYNKYNSIFSACILCHMRLMKMLSKPAPQKNVDPCFSLSLSVPTHRGYSGRRRDTLGYWVSIECEVALNVTYKDYSITEPELWNVTTTMMSLLKHDPKWCGAVLVAYIHARVFVCEWERVSPLQMFGISNHVWGGWTGF